MAETTARVSFELVTPTRLLFTRDADMVVVPGGDGDFGVLPGHAPLLSTVRPGVVDVYEGDAVTDRVFVAGGFAEVTGERCTVLAEEAIQVAELSREEAERRVAEARQRVEAADTDSERGKAEADLGAAEAMAAAAGATGQG